MHDFQVILVLLVLVALLVAVSRRVNVPYPILLVLGGLALGFVPWLPDVDMKPEMVLVVFLPPLLYSDARHTSWRDFRANLRPIGLLAIGLVLITTGAVAAVAHALVPGLPWAAAFVLGAIVAPTDAVAAGQIAKRFGLPARVTTIVEGESLVNDASALVLYNIALGAVATGAFSALGAGGQFLLVAAGGVVIGLLVAWLLSLVLTRLDDPPVENTLSLLAPFAAYLPAEGLHVSGVLAAVTAGLFLGNRNARLMGSRTRLQAEGFWEMLTFLLNGLLFILVGLQLHIITLHLGQYHLGTLLWQALCVSATVIVVRFAWVFAATYLPQFFSRRLRRRDPPLSSRHVAVLSWMGLRGGISLAAALALPFALPDGRAFPARPLLLFLTFGVIFATLVVQGLSLPWLIKRLGVTTDDIADREETQARQAAARAALARLDALAREPWVSKGLASFQREYYRRLTQHYSPRDGGGFDDAGEGRAAAYTRLRRELVTAERESVIALRDAGTINDTVLARVQRDLDLEELRLE